MEKEKHIIIEGGYGFTLSPTQKQYRYLLNPDTNEVSRTIKSQYYKNSLANFIRQGTFGATAIIERYEKNN